MVICLIPFGSLVSTTFENWDIIFRFSGLGVLLSSYAYGMTSQRYTGMSDDNVVTEIIANLALVFNKTEDFLRGRLVQNVIKRWGTDPHQLGGFAVQGAHEVSM